jgi:hypothetical protein
MEAKLAYPVMLIAMHKNHVSPKVTLCQDYASVHLNEVAEEDIPVAARIVNQTKPKEFRWDGQHFYRSSGKPVAEYVEYHNSYVGIVGKSNYLAWEMMEEIRDRAQAYGIERSNPSVAFPQDFERFLKKKPLSGRLCPMSLEGISTDGDWKELHKGFNWFDFFPTSDVCLERALSTFLSKIDSIRVVDGIVWERTSEPAYRLKPKDFSSLDIAPLPSGHKEFEKLSENDYWSDINTWSVSALDEHLLEDRCQELGCRLVGFSRLEPIITQAFRRDMDMVNLDRIARIFLHEIAFTSSLQDDLLPTDLYSAWSNLAQTLRSYDPTYAISETIVADVERLVSVIEGYPSSYATDSGFKTIQKALEWADMAEISFDNTGMRP